MKKRILVVGGGRFPGFQLCKHLLNKGHHVICLDGVNDMEAELLDQLALDEHFVSLNQDINDPIKVEVDEIYNLADSAALTLYQADPLKAMRQHTEVTNNLLKLAVATNARLLHMSMRNTYSDFQLTGTANKTDPLYPLACQQEAQQSSEQLCEDYRQLYNLDIRIARADNIYGPYLPIDKGLLIADMIVQALMNRPITLETNRDAFRMTYVDDLVANMYHMMQGPHATHAVTSVKSFSLTLHELASKIVDLTQSSSPIHGVTTHKQFASRDTSIDIQRSWQQKVRLEQGLMKTIDYVEHQLHSNMLLDNAIRLAHAKRYPFAAFQEYR